MTFLLLTATHTKKYHCAIYLGDKCVHQDSLCIPDVFHMNNLIERYNDAIYSSCI